MNFDYASAFGASAFTASGVSTFEASTFAAGFAFILINRLTGSIFGVTSDILADKGATVHTLLGQINQGV